MTNYIVLKKLSDANRWAIVGQAEAHSPTAAAKKAGGEGADGLHLAVPISNAHFVTLSTEQPAPRTTAVLVDADTYLGEQLPLDGAAPDPDPVAA